MSDIIYCGCCYSMESIDPETDICDTCEDYYCEECSYTFSIHYQFQGARCYMCADQRRRNPLSKAEKRDNKLKYFLIFVNS